MPVLQLNSGLVREFKVDELTNNLAFPGITPPVQITSTNIATTLAAIEINVTDINNPIWLNATIGWLAVVNPARLFFKIFRNIDNTTNQLIFSTTDSNFAGIDERITTSFSHVDLPPITPCSEKVKYTLTVELFDNPAGNSRGDITGPITFIGAEIQSNNNLVQITHTPDNL